MWYGQYGEMWEETEDETVYLLTVITVTYRYTNRYLPLFEEGRNEEGEIYLPSNVEKETNKEVWICDN